MLKSLYVHFLNKFPSAKVELGETSVAAYSPSGELLMHVSKNGLGVEVDSGRDRGAKYAFCNSPIPKEARHKKLFKDGSVRDAEECAARRPHALALEKEFGYVPCELQLKHRKVIESEIDVQERVPVKVVDAQGERTEMQMVAKKEKVKKPGALPSAAEAIAMEKGLSV